YALGVEMLRIGRQDSRKAGQQNPEAELGRELEAVVRSGRALEKLKQIIEPRGGDPRGVDHPSLLPQAPVTRQLRSPEAGLITDIEPRPVGHGVIWLGGGGNRAE